MEISKHIINEEPFTAGSVRVIVAAEVKISWSVQKTGIYIFFSKKPVFVLMESPGHIDIIKINGESLTLAEAEAMLPGISGLLNNKKQ